MRSSVAKAIVAVGVVTALAGVLRFYHLGRPSEKVFDEVYYARDGCWHAGIDYRECGLESDVEISWVHPPLGKQLIAAGIDVFGNDPFGWRVSAATAGTMTVALTGALAFLLTGSVLWAGAGSLLLATENLNFVQSRISMLDIFLALFVVLGFLLLVADRRRHPSVESDRARVRPLRLAAGAAFGAAIAVKWSGMLALLGAAGLALAWERTRRKAEGRPRPLLGALREESFSLFLAFAVVPFLVYLITWIPWLADRGFDLGEWARHQGDMAGYHFGLDTVQDNGEPVHPYMRAAWTWFLMLRPVAYYWDGTDTTGAEILGMGNPFLFWGALFVVPYLALAWRRDWRAGAVLVPILAQYLPWLAVSRPLFLFYMTPVTPFLALGTVHLLRDLIRTPMPDRRFLVPAAAAVVVVSVGMFAFFWPVLVGDAVSLDAWRARMWFGTWI